METTKKILFVLFTSLAIFTTACSKENNNNDDDTGKTGTLQIDGVSYTGNTEIQTFVNDSYSILCQQDEPFKLIQITFHNQAEAEAGGTFTVDDYTYSTIPSGKVNIGVDGLTFNPNSTSYTISVSGNKISIGSINLTSTGAGTTSTTINSASINF